MNADGPAPTSALAARRPIRVTASAADGAYRFVIDATDAPDLAEWAAQTLAPLLAKWYPKLVAWLPGEGWCAPSRVALRFRGDMGGTPAFASGGIVNLNAVWFRRERSGEGTGAVIHELLHVVQDYGRAKGGDGEPVPGWLTEGIADYIRWFRYEPEKQGAAITARNVAGARCDGSYRVTANFLDWVSRTYDPELVQSLNASARGGRYREALWRQRTGKPLEALGDEWHRANARRLGMEN